MRKKGFTLVELLAVIVILAIILAIAVPGISSIINSTTKQSFESDTKLLLTALNYEKLKNDNFDATTITIDSLSSLNLSKDNYEYLRVGMNGNNPYIVLKGKNKWSGLVACGVLNSVTVFESDNINVCENTFGYTGDYQTYTVPRTGNYQMELWGASGGGTTSSDKGISLGGSGGYTKGTISLTKDQILYIYIGQGSTTFTSANVSDASLYATRFNGGGAGAQDVSEAADIGEHGFPGGGATDIRITNGTWNDTNGLRSRIMVAAGGGGGGWSGNGTGDQYYTGGGGSGGGLNGFGALNATSSTRGTQTAGAAFGIGGNGTFSSTNPNNNGTGGGGGGYYGGAQGLNFSKPNSSGSGGSSFISGYPGCNAIDVNGNHTGQPNHYSGKVFINGVMIDGNSVMPNPTGGTETGHSGNGYARITYLGN